MVLFGADKDIILDATNFIVIQRIFQWFCAKSLHDPVPNYNQLDP